MSPRTCGTVRPMTSAVWTKLASSGRSRSSRRCPPLLWCSAGLSMRRLGVLQQKSNGLQCCLTNPRLHAKIELFG